MWFKLGTQLPLIMYLVALLVLAAAYFPPSEKTRQRSGRIVSRTAAVVLTFLAIAFTVSFGIPSLDTFRNARLTAQEALLGAVIVEAFCLCLWFVAIRCIVLALRRDSPRPDRS